MRLRRTAAVVLNHRDFGESDQIVTFFTHAFGKIRGIARGAKKSRRRFANQLGLFSLVQPVFEEKGTSSLAGIKECDLLRPFSAIRQVPTRYAYAAYFCELVDAAAKERDPDTELFHLLVWALSAVDEGLSLAPVSVIFHLRFLSIVGYGLTFTNCIACNAWKGGEIRYGFDHAKGGIVCTDCDPGLSLRNPLSPGTVKLLSLAQKMPLTKLSRLHFGVRSVRESESVLESFTHNMLGREIKSFQFLSQTRRHEAGVTEAYSHAEIAY